jgi:hypothetical protein
MNFAYHKGKTGYYSKVEDYFEIETIVTCSMFLAISNV